MKSIVDIVKSIESSGRDGLLTDIYGDDLPRAKERIRALAESFTRQFGTGEASLFSCPGRSELGGNHTDHNLGCVVATSIPLDSIAWASPSDDGTIRIVSEGYGSIFEIHTSELDVVDSEKESSAAIIRGVVRGIVDRGGKVGGFNACITSEVLSGSGLSSSASFEVLIANILNHFYNGGSFSPVEIAKIGQFAENVYFGKPCGLMDQVACAHGGIIGIDFRDPENPILTAVDYSFSDRGYKFFVVDTGGSHADLTGEYASMPEEMKSVAAFFQLPACRDLSFDDLYSNINDLRRSLGDRAVLRALHFIAENKRAQAMVEALKADDLDRYFGLVLESGSSSFQYLQNIFTPTRPNHQGLSLALALTEKFLNKTGAFRVQGGGFAGTIESYIPSERADEYKQYMENVFGAGCAVELGIRHQGAIKIL